MKISLIQIFTPKFARNPNLPVRSKLLKQVLDLASRVHVYILTDKHTVKL